MDNWKKKTKNANLENYEKKICHSENQYSTIWKIIKYFECKKNVQKMKKLIQK